MAHHEPEITLGESNASYTTEELYQALFEQAGDGIFIADATGRYIKVNRRGCEMLGYTLEELQTLTLSDLLPAEDKIADPLRLDDLRAGKSILKERRLLCKDGRPLPVEISAQILSNGHLLGIVRDISERKQAEEERLSHLHLLESNERRYREIFENVSDVIFLLDVTEDGRFLHAGANPAAERALGATAAETRGKTLAELLSPANAADLTRECQRCVDTGTALEYIQSGLSSFAKGYLYLRTKLLPIRDGEGRIYRIVGITEDITARQQIEELRHKQEQEFRALVENSPDFIGRYDREARVVYVNPALERLFSRPMVELVGKTAVDISPGVKGAQYFHSMVQGALSTGLPVETEIAVADAAGQKPFYHHLRFIPERDAKGETTSVLFIGRDITPQKEAEIMQAQLGARLRQSQKLESIGQLASGVAHDFNNLLTVILGYTELLKYKIASDEGAQRDLEQIHRASERAATLTRQLLAFSRQQMLTPVVLDLNALITDLHKMVGRLIREDIVLSVVLQPELCPIKADPSQIEQVLMNLIVNAHDAMPTGGQLTIETKNIYLDEQYAQTHFEVAVGSYVMVSVTDTGQGMDKATQARIFEPFFTTKEQGRGTGLGLATVYGIIKQSGGDISVYSEPGHGTTFKIYLPVTADTAVTPPPFSTSPARFHENTETILMVEDDDLVYGLVQRTLKEVGYTLMEARTGSEGLSIARQHQGKIDLLLTDVVMPQMSGRELAGQLQTIHPEMKVLFMSGYTNDVVVRHGLLTTKNEFLPKPFSSGQLTAKVREVLDK